MSDKVSKRKAGRPPLAPSDDAQVTMRRERDRLAQRHSRQRKANALAEKDERIDKLSRTIESLTSVFTDFNELVFKSPAIQSNFDTARSLKHLADRFLNVAQEAAREDDDEPPPDSALMPFSAPSPPHDPSSTPIFAPPALRNPNPIIYAQRPRSANSDGTYTLTHPGIDRSWSPRLTYGLMTNQTIAFPSSSTVTALPTCLRVPRENFGWRLLKSSLETGFPLFRTLDHSRPYAPRVLDLFQHTTRHESIADTCKYLVQIIEYYFTLWGSPLTERTRTLSRASPEFQSMENTALASRESKLLLSMLIKRDIHLAGEDINDYMHAWAVERYLQSAWGLELSATTVSLKPSFWSADPTDLPSPPPPSFGADPGAAMEFEFEQPADASAHAQTEGAYYAPFDAEFGAAVPAGNSERRPASRVADVFCATGVHSASTDELVSKIKNIGVCFGNGPRFHRRRVDEAVSHFLSAEGLVAEMGMDEGYTSSPGVGTGMTSVVAPV